MLKKVHTRQKKARKMRSRPVVQICLKSAMVLLAVWYGECRHGLRLGSRQHSLNGKLWPSFGWWKEWPSFRNDKSDRHLRIFVARTFRNDDPILISEWWVWPSFEKVSQIYFWFITDLSVHFQMMHETPFRYDGVIYFSIWQGFLSGCLLWLSTSFFRKWGGLTSCHNKNLYHLFYH